ncbi:MAG: undecaprenyl phosphate translocase family protein [Phycisphaeraceae bacterium]
MGEPPTERTPPLPLLLLRGVCGGTLMGLANLVPGISGGTMLLACGVYTHFVRGLAEVTAFRFRLSALVTLGSIIGAAAVAIVLLAGPVKMLVVEHRWVMYSLFIGLTLGGVPIIWRMVRPATVSMWVGCAAGFAAMAALALLQVTGAGAGEAAQGHFLMLFVAGLAGASAMILPGVSGGYLLLVLGQYVVILGAIDELRGALTGRDFAAAMEPALHVVLPVGLGVVLGVVGVSHLLKFLLARYARPTLGVLLGLLLGAVVGLWPFQQARQPRIGEMVKGRPVTEQRLQDLPREDYPTVFFTPAPGQVAGSAGLIVLGFALTAAVGWLGRERARSDGGEAADTT